MPPLHRSLRLLPRLLFLGALLAGCAGAPAAGTSAPAPSNPVPASASAATAPTWPAPNLGSVARTRGPELGAIQAYPASPGPSNVVNLSVMAKGAGRLRFKWDAPPGGRFVDDDAPGVQYIVPDRAGQYLVTVTVTDDNGTSTGNITLVVIASSTAQPAAAQAAPAVPDATSPASSAPVPPAAITEPPAPAPRPARPSGQARIAGPIAGAQVPLIARMFGTYPPDLQGDLWAYVVNENGRYFPQAPCEAVAPAYRSQNGRWESQVYAGDDASAGQSFDLVLAVAGPSASQAIMDRLRGWCNANTFPGLPNLPDGFTELDRVTVQRGTSRGPEPPEPVGTPAAASRRMVTLDSLHDDSRVDEEMIISGKVSAAAEGAVWALVHTSSGKWYPQSWEACKGVGTQVANGRWQTRGVFGGPEYDANPYDLVVVLADAAANATLLADQKRACDAGYYPGYFTVDLPQSMNEQARARVYRAVPPTPVAGSGFADHMEASAGWQPYQSEQGATREISAVRGKAGNALRIHFTLQPWAYVGMAKTVAQGTLAGTTGLKFYYRATGAANTVEVKLIYPTDKAAGKESVFSFDWSQPGPQEQWKEQTIAYDQFQCWTDTGCLAGETPDPARVGRVDFAVSNKPDAGNQPGAGDVEIDEVTGIR